LTRAARSIDVRRVRLNHGLPSCLALILFCSLWQGVDFFDTLNARNNTGVFYLHLAWNNLNQGPI
ncbi:MAG: hypothetical protein WBK78_09730, partial [Syntrophomonadaceae bacterium]